MGDMKFGNNLAEKLKDDDCDSDFEKSVKEIYVELVNESKKFIKRNKLKNVKICESPNAYSFGIRFFGKTKGLSNDYHPGLTVLLRNPSIQISSNKYIGCAQELREIYKNMSGISFALYRDIEEIN